MDSPPDLPTIGRDPDAFEAFYREHLPWVRRFVARRVDDPHTAADLTADIFMAVVDGAAGYRPSVGTPIAWLAGVARNVVADHVRRRVRESRANARISGRALLDEQSAERIAERIDGERLARQLYRSLAGLPDSQRAVVELVAVDGLTLVEAAQAPFVMVLSVEAMTQDELSEVSEREGQQALDGTRSSVSAEVARDPVGPCEAVPAAG